MKDSEIELTNIRCDPYSEFRGPDHSWGTILWITSENSLPKDLSISEIDLAEKFLPSKKGSPKSVSTAPDLIRFKALSASTSWSLLSLK